jgi:hypothetical protein
MQKQMTNSTKLLAILSLSFFAACETTPVKPPQGARCAVNQHPLAGDPYKLCFDLSKDYDDKLKLKPGAKGEHLPVGDLHKNWCHDSDSEAELHRWASEWQARYEQMKKDLDECRSK